MVSTANSGTESVLAEFELSPEEAVTLALAKLRLMLRDANADPDEKDRVAKKPVVREYAKALHAAFADSPDAVNELEPTESALIARIGDPDWASEFMACLGSLPFDLAFDLMTSTKVVDACLRTISDRKRAVLITVELSAFYPWPKKVKYEKRKRRELLDEMAKLMPGMTVEYSREIDRELAKRTRILAIKSLKWKRVGLLAGGGAVIGLLTGGLAAPIVGGLIGVYALGLSGAAATTAGLALLGGGSLAAGGAGVAGGTLIITTAVGAGGAAMGSAGASVWGLVEPKDVLADMAKLEVLTKYMFVRGRSDQEKARKVAVATEQRLRIAEEELEEMQAQCGRMKAIVDELQRQRRSESVDNAELADKLATAEEELRAAKDEIANLTESEPLWRSSANYIARRAEKIPTS